MSAREDVASSVTERFWDERYRAADRIWSGNSNAILVREVAALAPKTALDLGCGEGGCNLARAARLGRDGRRRLSDGANARRRAS